MSSAMFSSSKGSRISSWTRNDVNHPMFRLADRAIDELVRLALKQSEERVAHMVSVRFPSAVDLKFLSL
jgi:hypothetical protein